MGSRVLVAAAGPVLLAATLLGCGSEESASDVSGLVAADEEYDGPLHLAEGRYGAAGAALACEPAAGQVSREAIYGGGATSEDVQEALRTAVSEGLFLLAPTDQVRLAKAEDDRAMLTYEADGRILMALVFRDGPATEGAGGRGWYLEAAARCDLAEFPERFAEQAGYRLWRDRDGAAVPVSQVYSSPGPEHCDWHTMEFLYVDEGHDVFVQDPTRELTELVSGPYRPGVALPGDAVDTGYERDGRHLWLADDGRYAYVGTRSRVDAWPRFDAGCA